MYVQCAQVSHSACIPVHSGRAKAYEYSLSLSYAAANSPIAQHHTAIVDRATRRVRLSPPACKS